MALTEKVSALDADPDPQYYFDAIETIRASLATDPKRTLANAPAILGHKPTVEEALRLLKQAQDALEAPVSAMATLVANLGGEGESVALPMRCRSTGEPVEINPYNRQFEESDWAAWAVTAVEAFFARQFGSKPDFLLHGSNDAYRYPLVENAGVASAALFSDWGTGLYHSQLIACDIAARGPGQAVHLGDVYYTGRASEFRDRCVAMLQQGMLQRMPVYSLNANHEMDTNGVAYFKFLDWKLKLPQPDYATQRQQASYFCLHNQNYQIIGIDTAYSRNGRLAADTYTWLTHQLQHGRIEGKINILLSQNEPYDRLDESERDLLGTDLGALRGKIDLWFWGDEHYAALWGPRGGVPFFGSCIGHGGFPYERLSQRCDFMTPLADLIWCGTGFRMEARRDRGNNGYVWLDMKPDELTLIYIDWRGHVVDTRTFAVASGKLRMT
ncbi:MAG: metallophosphoesterase [Bryobacteraceae bacterium]|nr:metallophosphoesterase [Bryobacteraceae bacterium]